MRTFFEFFAGGGMARAGLEPDWTCVFANDFDHKKCETYRQNWGDQEIRAADVGTLQLPDLPRTPHLVWASFPCQDLSLAGGGAGLKGDRSGTFWPFWELMREMERCGPPPNFIVLENVCGTLTSHEGKDFQAIISAFQKINFAVGAMVVDAELFVPQSRPRLFFIGVPKSLLPSMLDRVAEEPQNPWHPASLRRAYMALPNSLKDNWIWWRMPPPAKRRRSFADLIESNPSDVAWHSAEETRRLLAMMTSLHRRKVEQAKAAKRLMVGTIYRRTRREDGNSIQRAEVRFDDVAGCLRTPAGGSSRQVLMVVEGKRVRSRLISARETARLMGLPDSYILPERYNEAYHLTGDGVVVPVIRHLSEHILLPPKNISERRMVA